MGNLPDPTVRLPEHGIDDNQADVWCFMSIAAQPIGDIANPALTPISGPNERAALEIAAKLCHLAADILKAAATEAPNSRALRGRFIAEETGEFLDAMVQDDLPGAADALVDLEYVLKGAAVSFGIELRAVWLAVHKANMAKMKCPECNGLGGHPDAEEPALCLKCGGKCYAVIRDAAGKVQKPPGWAPADIAAVLEAQRAWQARRA